MKNIKNNKPLFSRLFLNKKKKKTTSQYEVARAEVPSCVLSPWLFFNKIRHFPFIESMERDYCSKLQVPTGAKTNRAENKKTEESTKT